MRRSALALAAAALLSGSALAADPAPAARGWDGLSASLNASYSAAAFDWHDRDGAFDYSLPDEYLIGPNWDEVFKTDAKGFGIGADIGYMGYVSQKDLLGIQASVRLPDLSDSRQTCLSPGPCDVDSKLQWDGSLRLRWGRDYGSFMPYLAGGLAFGSFKHAFVESLNLPQSWPDAGGFAYGWTAGAGSEFALSDNWSLKAEVNYTDFSDTSEANSIGRRMQVSHDMWTGLIGVSYRFK